MVFEMMVFVIITILNNIHIQTIGKISMGEVKKKKKKM